jgi:leader peptidase (prepilin peptidase) / N-methyltransferase
LTAALGGLLAFAWLGLMVGSFLNVCIHRIPRRQSIAWPSSHCPRCRQPIAWYDNVPVVSYLALGGRCRRCRGPISARYPLVEAVTAVLFALHFWELGWQPLLAVRLAFAAAMVVLFMIDLEHQILPNVITLPGVLVGLAASAVLPPGLLSAALGVAVGGGVLWTVSEAYYRWRGVEGLGMGDVKMLAMIGAFLGWPLTLLTLVLASLAGAVVGLSLIAAGRGDRQLKLPFGTFLAAGAVVSGLWGTPLVEWYLGFYP